MNLADNYLGRKRLVNRVALVLDRSGSMEPMTIETIGVFNKQLETLRENSKEQDTFISLFTFSDVADEPIFFDIPIEEARQLTREDYKPSGWTAMWDGVGKAIERLSALPDAEDPNTSFLVIVITDGDENHSIKYNDVSLAEMIQSKQNTRRWTFSVLGANIDLSKIEKRLHIPAGNMMGYVADSAGLNAASGATSACVSQYLSSRSAGQTCSENFYNPSQDTGLGNP